MIKKIYSKKRFKSIAYTIGALSISISASSSYAGGLQLFEQSAASLGTAHAGTAAGAEADASSEFYNPAAMVLLDRPEASVGITAINLKATFKGEAGSELNLRSNQNVITHLGNDLKSGQVSTNQLVPVPNAHFVYPINKNVYLGWGITVPFGLVTDYGDNSFVKDYATTSSLNVINFSQSLAVRLNNRWSVGGGIDFQQLHAELDSNVSANIAENFNKSGKTIPHKAGGLPEGDIVIGPSDFHLSAHDTLNLTNKLSDWGFGWHAGLLFQYSPSTRFGISYHSSVNHNARGTGEDGSKLTDRIAGHSPSIKWRPLPNIAPNLGPSLPSENIHTSLPGSSDINDTVTSDFIMPASVNLSGFHQLNPKWAVMASAIYTQWSVIKALGVQHVPLLATGDGTYLDSAITIPMNFKDTWSYTVGAHYQLTPKLMLRFGGGLDPTPVQDAYRELRVPDGDKKLVSLGLHYQYSKDLGFDAGYEHAFIDSNKIDRTIPFVTAKIPLTHQTLELDTLEKGDVTGQADLFGGQVTYKF